MKREHPPRCRQRSSAEDSDVATDPWVQAERRDQKLRKRAPRSRSLLFTLFVCSFSGRRYVSKANSETSSRRPIQRITPGIAQRGILYFEIIFFQGISEKVYSCRAKKKKEERKLSKGPKCQAHEGMHVLSWQWTSCWYGRKRDPRTPNCVRESNSSVSPGVLRGGLASGQSVCWVWFVTKQLKCCFMTWVF